MTGRLGHEKGRELGEAKRMGSHLANLVRRTRRLVPDKSISLHYGEEMNGIDFELGFRRRRRREHAPEK